MPAYALTILTGAFLLFQVQPLIGKYILPWFGGGPGVWTTCMLFFQVLLVAGYAYAHLLARRLNFRAQAVLQVVLVAVALLTLPISPGDAFKPRDGGQPMAQILALLLVNLGLPYFVLSSTGPLMQHWFSRAHPGRSPYRLYALSNAGSLLALVSYPVLFEAHLSRRNQATFWGWGLVAYALFTIWAAVSLWRTMQKPGQPAEHLDAIQNAGNAREPSLNRGEEDAPMTDQTRTGPGSEAQRSPSPSLGRKLMWVLLPACASVLLLAVTNKLCQDVASVPFLWVLPLVLYLLSFIICFDSPRWYARFPFTLALVASLAGLCWALFHGSDLEVSKQVGLYGAGLFICCMVCHGELYRLRPAAEHLTAFYLMVAVGGALGGTFVAVVAPVLFTGYYELHWGLVACAALFFLVCAGERGAADDAATWRRLGCVLPLLGFAGLDWLLARGAAQSRVLPVHAVPWMRAGVWITLALLVASWILRGNFRRFRHWRFLVCCWLLLGSAALGVTLWMQARKSSVEAVYHSRNFYGVLTVFEHRRHDPEGHHYLLQHGRITHGLQLLGTEQRKWPTTYYGEQSGIGLALKALPVGFRRIGLVGLGTGTLAAYGEPGDHLRFYELNPEVTRLAQTQFTYLRDTLAQVEVVPGDARLSLEKEPPQNFDLLALDAFSSDSIPVHLLTEQAFAVYDRHLKADGVIAVHISNHFLDLEPVVSALALRFNFGMALIDYDEEDDRWWLYGSSWVLLSRNANLLCSPEISAATKPENQKPRKPLLWTDDYAALYPILK